MNKIIYPKENISGVFSVPGDKSISHRAVMFGSISKGIAEVEGFLDGEDCRATIDCFRELGIKIEQNGDKVKVFGKGLRGLEKPSKQLYAGNSGTTIRLMSGILAAQDFDCEITGDGSIQKRPMGRVIAPLSLMGADIRGKVNENLAPLAIRGGKLHGIDYTLPVASAQVKSAIILASLYADGETVITEPAPSRDHTEIMLNYLGANITSKNGKIISNKTDELYAKKVMIPGDISSAAYLIVAGLIVPDSKIIITDVGVNITRTGIISALRQMGGNIEVLNRRLLCGEWVADIAVSSSKLVATTLKGSIIPRLIDEIPVFAVAALSAEGKTVIKDAQELKVKESNRIRTMAAELGKMGAEIIETEDGMIIEGGQSLHGAKVESHGDHRVAMSLAVAALTAKGETEICGAECADVSFPAYYEAIGKL